MRRDLETAFCDFTARVHERMEAGAETYGDRSLSMDPPQTIDEIQQELEDVCGWGALLWWRLERLKPGAAKLMGED